MENLTLMFLHGRYYWNNDQTTISCFYLVTKKVVFVML